MKLAIIHADPSRKLSARLTRFWTGSTAYHCGFVDDDPGQEDGATFFDMNLLPRKVSWPRYHGPVKWVLLFDAPLLTRAKCERLLRRDGAERYGVLDYALFALRPLYHLFGKSTRNASGIICSELCARWLNDAGYGSLPLHPVPSPADLEAWAREHLRALPSTHGGPHV